MEWLAGIMAVALGGIYQFFASLGISLGEFNFLNAAETGHVWWKPLSEWF
jgi:hypothetical protein